MSCISRLPTLLLCLGLVLVQGPGWTAGRGGGGKGGGGDDEEASTSSSYRSYRTSGGYTGLYARRYNYYSSSNYYLSYVPTASYTRSYIQATMGALYWSYYSRYYYYVGTAKYASRGNPTNITSVSVCANYAAGENGTYMGLFTCPLDFEPTTFTACCGDDYEEYCCEPEPEFPKWVISLIIIFGILGTFVFVFGTGYGKKSTVEPQEEKGEIYKLYY